MVVFCAAKYLYTKHKNLYKAPFNIKPYRKYLSRPNAIHCFILILWCDAFFGPSMYTLYITAGKLTETSKEAAKKSYFLSGPATKAFNPPPLGLVAVGT